MMTCRRILAAITLALAACGAVAAAAAPVPLVAVNGDTLNADDLARELSVMMAKAPEDIRFEAPPAGQVLRRLIQNELVIQEGYRMGLDQQFTVRNSKSDAVRGRCIRALLDSVAAEVPQGAMDRTAWVEARRVRVADYLAQLRKTHSVVIDTVLLKSLDYGSSEPAVKTRLRDSEEVLAVLPNGSITIAGLTREIQFIAFHGLEGKPDAAARRDRIFWENLHERVVALEAKRLGLDRRSDIVAYGANVEKSLMLEESLAILVTFDFAPTPDEVRAYYKAHTAAVTPAPRIRMESVKLNSEEEAKALRAKALQGAKLAWLAKNMPGVVDGPPPFPAEFFAPEQLGLDPAKATLGLIPEPYGVPGGWVVARIAEVEAVQPRPLGECREEILRMMKAEATKAHMTDVLARLEEISTIEVLPGAEDEVARLTALAVDARAERIERKLKEQQDTAPQAAH